MTKTIGVNIIFKSLLFVGQCWFISKNGTDSDSCGRNLSNPCKTLDELLTIIYASENSTSFCIVTDFSLLINRATVVRYPLLDYLYHV